MQPKNYSMNPSLPGPGRPTRTDLTDPQEGTRDPGSGSIWLPCGRVAYTERQGALTSSNLPWNPGSEAKRDEGHTALPSPTLHRTGTSCVCEQINCSSSRHSSLPSAAHTHVHTRGGAETQEPLTRCASATARLRLPSHTRCRAHPPGVHGKGSLRGLTQASCRGDTVKGHPYRQTAGEAMTLATSAMVLL